jgi:hypothetical protein
MLKNPACRLLKNGQIQGALQVQGSRRAAHGKSKKEEGSIHES